MDAALKSDRDSVMAEIEENQKNVREMVMESYRDMQSGKGRNYREFSLKWKVGMTMQRYDVIILLY